MTGTSMASPFVAAWSGSCSPAQPELTARPDRRASCSARRRPLPGARLRLAQRRRLRRASTPRRCVQEAARMLNDAEDAMKLTVFQSDKGDCLLLTGDGGEHDAGRRRHARGVQRARAPALARCAARATAARPGLRLATSTRTTSPACSQLLDDMVAWRVHDFQARSGNPTHTAPKVPRPPDVAGDLAQRLPRPGGQQRRPDRDLLAASAAVLAPGRRRAGGGRRAARAREQHPRGDPAVARASARTSSAFRSTSAVRRQAGHGAAAAAGGAARIGSCGSRARARSRRTSRSSATVEQLAARERRGRRAAADADAGGRGAAGDRGDRGVPRRPHRAQRRSWASARR